MMQKLALILIVTYGFGANESSNIWKKYFQNTSKIDYVLEIEKLANFLLCLWFELFIYTFFQNLLLFIVNIDMEIIFIGLKLDFVGCDLIGSRPYVHFRLVTETRQTWKDKKKPNLNFVQKDFNLIWFDISHKNFYLFCLSFISMLRLLTERFTEIMLRIIPEHIYNTNHATFLKFFTGGLKKKNISYDKFLSIYSDWKISLVEIASLFFESFLNKFATVGYIIPKYKLYIQNFNCMRPCTICTHRQCFPKWCQISCI